MRLPPLKGNPGQRTAEDALDKHRWVWSALARLDSDQVQPLPTGVATNQYARFIDRATTGRP